MTLLKNIFTYNSAKDREKSNKALVEKILTEKIISDWKNSGITHTELSVTSSLSVLNISFKLNHPQKGILIFKINRKWNGEGRIGISSGSAHNGCILPNNTEEAIKKLQEIIIEATQIQTTH